MDSPLFTVEDVCSESGVASMNRAGSERKLRTICLTCSLSGYFCSRASNSRVNFIRMVAIRFAAFCLSAISRTLYILPSTVDFTVAVGKFPPPTMDLNIELADSKNDIPTICLVEICYYYAPISRGR